MEVYQVRIDHAEVSVEQSLKKKLLTALTYGITFSQSTSKWIKAKQNEQRLVL